MSRFDDDLWELVPDAGPPPRHLRRFVRGLPSVGDALDLGCGDGRLTKELRAERLTGADVSKVALARARRRLPEGGFVHVAPDEPLPFADTGFDLVLCAETLEHARDVQLLLSEARRVLRPGGTLAVTTPAHGRLTAVRAVVTGFEKVFDPLSPHLRFFTARSLTGLLDQLGFDVPQPRRSGGTLLVNASR
ncbi:MAG: class I SAM-dependent methyltransferase [Actinomycetota bacterium]|nr:class I SAM-dependent methyltransferase [Actinomycetota bacterium]